MTRTATYALSVGAWSGVVEKGRRRRGAGASYAISFSREKKKKKKFSGENGDRGWKTLKKQKLKENITAKHTTYHKVEKRTDRSASQRGGVPPTNLQILARPLDDAMRPVFFSGKLAGMS